MSLRSIFSSFRAFGRTSSARKPARGFIPKNAGFMLIELLISIVIMSALSSVVLSANSNMSARLQTDNLAHMIALTIREAQTKALSAAVPIGETTAPGYGIYLSEGSSAQIVRFTETGSARSYVPAESDTELTPSFTIGQGFSIAELGAIDRGTGYPVSNVRAFSIFFKRPSPDANIWYSTGTNDVPNTQANAVSIVVRSPKAGITKTVTVTSTGQITVQ